MSHRETERRAVSFFLFRYLVGEIPHLGGGQITVIPAVRNGKDGRGKGDGFFFFLHFFWGGKDVALRCAATPIPLSLFPYAAVVFIAVDAAALFPHIETGGKTPLSPPSGERRTIWLLRRGGAHIKVGGGGDGYWSHVPRSPLPLSTNMSRWSEQRRRMGKRVLCSPSPFS